MGESALRLRPASAADVAALLALINSYADRNLLLRRSEESLRARLADFSVAESGGELVACAALSELGPGIGEVRSLAVRADQTGRGVGHALVEHLLYQAGERRFAQVLALTRRVSFFAALGFEVTERTRFEDKLRTDCQFCPLNVCCDETALVRPPLFAVRRPRRHGATESTEAACSNSERHARGETHPYGRLASIELGGATLLRPAETAQLGFADAQASASLRAPSSSWSDAGASRRTLGVEARLASLDFASPEPPYGDFLFEDNQ